MNKTQLYYELYDYILEWVNHINPCEIRINSKNKLTCKGIESKQEQNRNTFRNENLIVKSRHSDIENLILTNT